MQMIFAVTEKGRNDMENEVKTVTIPIDEYFELKQRAERFDFLASDFCKLSGQVGELSNLIFNISGALRRE